MQSNEKQNLIKVRQNSITQLSNKKLQRNLKNATATTLKKRCDVIRKTSAVYEKARENAIDARDNSIENLEKNLECFIKNAKFKGIKVFVYDDYDMASAKITEIIKSKNADFTVKSKSMLTEEMRLNHYLEEHGISPIETDLGEFIVQLCGELPAHLTAPALHKSKEEVAEIFNRKLNMPLTDDINQMTAFARSYLRDKFLSAKVGITGANFAVTETGSIAVIENEGNARMCLTLPQTHIAVFGAEKLIPKFSDIPNFLEILSKSATGQLLNAYTTITSAPEAGHERYYIIVTKNRFKIASDAKMKKILRCIRCGACQNVCPVFQRLASHGYEFTYGGPIGIMLAPFFKGIAACEEMLDASTLCGFCKSLCPMKIDIPEIIIEHRKRLAKLPASSLSLKRIVKKCFSFSYRFFYSYEFTRSLIPYGIRFAEKLSNKISGRFYIPFWDKFRGRNFIKAPEKTFFEEYFKK